MFATQQCSVKRECKSSLSYHHMRIFVHSIAPDFVTTQAQQTRVCYYLQFLSQKGRKIGRQLSRQFIFWRVIDKVKVVRLANTFFFPIEKLRAYKPPSSSVCTDQHKQDLKQVPERTRFVSMGEWGWMGRRMKRRSMYAKMKNEIVQKPMDNRNWKKSLAQIVKAATGRKRQNNKQWQYYKSK